MDGCRQVRHLVGAHKAVLMTNSGFSSGALAAAADEHMALIVVAPEFDCAALHPDNASLIQEQIAAIAAKSDKPIYNHQIIQKGLAASSAPLAPPAAIVPAGGAPAPAPSGGSSPFPYQTRQAGLPGGSSQPAPGRFGYRTKG